MKHLKKYQFLFLLLLFGFVSSFKAQETINSNFSLQQSIDYALKNSPNYLNSELDLKSAVYRKNEITGLGLPQITGSIDLKDYIDLPTSLLPGEFFGAPAGSYVPVRFGTKYNSTAGINASQLIYSSDYIFGLKASKEFINLSKISVLRSKAELASQVSKAYYTVVINRDRIKLLDANLIRLKKVYEDTKALNKEGFVELIDVERLEVQYNNLTTEKEKALKLISLSETMLKFQMGYKIGDPILLTDSLDVSNNEFQELNGNKADISKRPDYQLLKAQQSLLDIDVKRLKWGYMPTLVAYGAYQYNAQRQEFDLLDPSKKWFKIALVGATLNLNIFDGLQRHNKIQQAKMASLKNINTLKTIEQLGEVETTVAAISYNNAYSTLLIQKKNMDLANHVYDVVQQKYKQGVGSNIEVVNAEVSLKEAQTNYYNAVFDMYIYKIDYLKATGNLIK
ncbi:MAG: TolC family protein [Bacteroidota bacterium]|nr:TolC family protein [Bacteroidota bacterium]MDP3147466.1 TolC family protein [Bacteroidota bacterium]MDP3557958.1 TolC family protein [Bacteroidota bacterium]